MTDFNKIMGQIKRFQSFKGRTGCSKSSSYSVSISFPAYTEDVYIEFGGYDVGGDWSRHEYLSCHIKDFVEVFTKKVDEADELTKDWAFCESCGEHTVHDEGGNCLGYYDWDKEVKCKGETND